MDTSASHIHCDVNLDGNTSGWIPWKVKQGRLQSIPGCQNTDSLSKLAEDVKSCEDGDYCYYFRCQKCLPLLALDYFVPEHKTDMKIIPQIENMKPKGSFSIDTAYHGEKVEFHDYYLSRMVNLRGIAVNGWNNNLAKSVFESVENTFRGTKYEKSQDFEIDWLIFSGSSLTVVEVGMRGETETKVKNAKLKDELSDSLEQERNDWAKMNEQPNTTKVPLRNEVQSEKTISKQIDRPISKKIDQMVQNDEIIKHLLGATNCLHVAVNYILFYPNISTDIIFDRIERLYKEAQSEKRQFSLDKIISCERMQRQVQFGIVGSTSIPQKAVHLYVGEGKFGDAISMEKILMSQDAFWTSHFRYLTATVLTSCLMTTSKHNPIEKEGKRSSNSKKDDPKTAMHASVGFNAKNRPRSLKFPTDLILGPEQIEVIEGKLKRNKNKCTMLVGEPGSGKTTTLLAILFKHTGKHVSPKKLQKVVFFIPEEKEDFRRHIRNFITSHCQPEWVKVSSLRSLGMQIFNDENIYLIDEYYGSGPQLAKFLSYTRGNFIIALISAKSSHDSITTGFETQSLRVFFRRSYRTPEAISRVCSKLRRLIDRMDGKDSHMNIPWAMSFYNGAPMNTRAPFKFVSYSHCITSMLSDISCELGDRSLCASLDIDFITSQRVDEAFYQHTVHHLSSQTLTIQKIPFTGNEFKSVAIIFGEPVDPWSYSTLLFLHSAVSRATKNVYVLCIDAVLDTFKSILSVSDESDIIFEKLRSGDNLGPRVFDYVHDPKDKLEVLKRTLVRENCDQFSALKTSATDNLSAEEKQLLPCLWVMQKKSPKMLPEVVDILNFVISLSPSNLQLPLNEALEYLVCRLKEVQMVAEFGMNYNKPSPLTLDQNLISYLEAFADNRNCTDEFIFNILDRLKNQGFSEEAEIYQNIFNSEFVAAAVKAFIHIVSKRPGRFIFDARIIYRLALHASPNLAEKLLQKSNSGSCLIHHLAARNFGLLFDALQHIPENLKFSDETLIDNFGQHCLMLAVTNFLTFEMVVNRAKEQSDLGKLLTLRDVYGWTCLRWACRADNLKVIKILIFHGADWANDIDNEGRTLIHLVSTFDHAQILQYFLSLDLKLPEPLQVTEREDNFGMTCLHVACFFGREDIFRLIVDKAPDLANKLFFGINCFTIVSWCIIEGKNSLINMLREELPIQNLDEVQKFILEYCIGKTYSLSYQNFTDLEAENKVFLKIYFTFMPSMIVMALFNLP